MPECDDAEVRRARWRADHLRNREKRIARMRLYHQKNRSRLLEKRRMFYAENIEEIRKHDKARWQGARQQQGNLSRQERTQKERLSRPWTVLVRAAKERAKRKSVPFSLTDEWGEKTWTGRCTVTGIQFQVGLRQSGPKFLSPSIDRIVPSLGYIPENCRFVVWAVNAMKHNGSDDDMYQLAEAILRNRPKSFHP